MARIPGGDMPTEPEYEEHDLFRTEDHREGVAAFLEKREPRFEGR